MQLKPYNAEVVFAADSIVQIAGADLAALKVEAAQNPRRRKRICAHPDSGDRLHEMFIVHERGCYVRPHKHLEKCESLHVIEGTAEAVFFNEDGSVRDVVLLGDYRSGAPFFYRVGEPVYHTLLITSPVFVFHETTGGPFRREDTIFAPWAPTEDQPEAVEAFTRSVEAAAAAFKHTRGIAS
ncbi:MAG: WbuC family cupin fold metalloprotein [Verrucomicrobia bacterium]|nr:WbuC family cupin fold metalloprotein [Verrucomicrobiota bacterium]